MAASHTPAPSCRTAGVLQVLCNFRRKPKRRIWVNKALRERRAIRDGGDHGDQDIMQNRSPPGASRPLVTQEPPRSDPVILVLASPPSFEANGCISNAIGPEDQMKNHVYKILEIVGSSQTGIEDAISTAIELASKTVRNMDWFEVVETRGHIKDGKIGHYQVTLKIGFTLETQ
jgi:flavin-binding protein dodecin